MKPRLLFLCQTLPYPPDGGVWIRTFHVLRLLSEAFDITALCFERAGSSTRSSSHDAVRSLEALSRYADVEVFEIPQRHSRLRFIWDHLRSVASGHVYTRFLYDSRAFRRQLRRLVKSAPLDLVHVDSLDLARYLPAFDDLPVVCVHHDIESALLRRRSAVERRWWRRHYLRYQSILMSHVERRWCGRIALNVVCSEDDQRLLQELAPGARTAVVPNGVDLDEFRPGDAAASGVAFVGGTSPFPNADALGYFCEQILPHIRAAGVDVRPQWIGRASAAEQQHYRDRYGVELTGYVEDARPFMRAAACHIVPMRAGGGTRLKILNAWAMGKAVVSTSLGCEGLAASDGDNILIRNDPESFAKAVVAVLTNDVLRRRLGAGGRLAAARYGWDAIGSRMIDAYLQLATGMGQPLAMSGARREPRVSGA